MLKGRLERPRKRPLKRLLKRPLKRPIGKFSEAGEPSPASRTDCALIAELRRRRRGGAELRALSTGMLDYWCTWVQVYLATNGRTADDETPKKMKRHFLKLRKTSQDLCELGFAQILGRLS